MPGYALWLIATALSAVIGHLIVALTLWLTEWWYRIKRRSYFEPLDIWIGLLERAIATTLVFYAPMYLAPFIGGWVVLKFALAWQRERPTIETEEAITRSFISLSGNVMSFASAIVIGVLLHPQALDAWSSSLILL